MVTLLITIGVAWICITTTLWVAVSSVYKQYRGFKMWLAFTLMPLGLPLAGIKALFKRKD